MSETSCIFASKPTKESTIPHEEQSTDEHRRKINHYPLSVTLFCPLRPAPELHRNPQRAIKAHSGGQDHFTEITLSDSRHTGGMEVEYFVKARSPDTARRVGTVYLSQLCDLLSAVTQSPVVFFADPAEAREQRSRQRRQAMRVERRLTLDEWSWVTGALVGLRRDHPRFLAAASWYRKGLIGGDCLDKFCCFWRVIERLASSYADKSDWSKEDGGVRKTVAQLTGDLFPNCDAPELLRDEDRVKKVIRMRNDISHGNEPITVDMIEFANDELAALEDAAFTVLDCLRHRISSDLELNPNS